MTGIDHEQLSSWCLIQCGPSEDDGDGPRVHDPFADHLGVVGGAADDGEVVGDGADAAVNHDREVGLRAGDEVEYPLQGDRRRSTFCSGNVRGRCSDWNGGEGCQLAEDARRDGDERFRRAYRLVAFPFGWVTPGQEGVRPSIQR